MKTSIFDKLFGRNKLATYSRQFLKMIDGYSPVFTRAPDSIYEMLLMRACIGQFATMCAKLQPHISGTAYKELKVILKNKPNPYMDTYKFIYKIATILAVNNTAFIVPLEDKHGYITGYYPIIPRRCEAVEYKDMEYLLYRFSNGAVGAIELDKVGIMTNYLYKDDLIGESNGALNSTKQLIHSTEEGTVQALQNSAKIRFMARVGNNFKPEQIRAAQKEFNETNLSSDNTSGLMVVDNKFVDLKQIEYTPYNVDFKRQEFIKNNVFNYFGINEKILQNAFNEDEWNSYYEGKIEPFAQQLSLVMTNMTFTPKELSFGNAITFTADRLQYASNSTKLNMAIQMFDRGLINRNQVMDLFNMPHVEDGDTYYIRKEYADVQSLEKEQNNASEE